MSDYPFDAEPGESEEEYYQRQRKASEASVGLMMSLARLVFMTLKFGVIYCFFLYIAFLLVKQVWDKEISSWKIAVLTLVLTYFMLCIIFLLKGVMLGLRANKNGWWKAIWIFCVIITCIPPIIVTKALALSLFSFHNQQLLVVQLGTWLAGLFMGLYVYNIYQFLTPVVPRIFHWSFVMGVKLMGYSFRT